MPPADTIFQRLRTATDAELAFISGCLKEKLTSDRGLNVVAISKALRSSSGNSFANFFLNDHERTYRSILMDCIEIIREKVGWRKFIIKGSPSENLLEEYISQASLILVGNGMQEVSPEQQAQRMIYAERVVNGEEAPPSTDYALIVGSSVSGAIGSAVGFSVALPIAIPILFVLYLASPSRFKILNCVLALIHIRKRIECEEHLEKTCRRAV